MAIRYLLISLVVVPPCLCMKRVPNWTEEKFIAARNLTDKERKQIIINSLASIRERLKIDRQILSKPCKKDKTKK